jgi:hypothetical protein
MGLQFDNASLPGKQSVSPEIRPPECSIMGDRKATSILVRHKRVFDEDEVLRMLTTAVEREGGQSAFARRHSLDRSNLNLVLSGKRPVTDAVARPLGLCGLYIAD